MHSSAAAMLIRACSGEIAYLRSITITRRVHSTVPLGGHVRGCELPATPGVPLPTKGTRTGESTRHTGRDAEGGGSFRGAQKRRSLPSRHRGRAVLGLGEAVMARRPYVRASLRAKACSGSGTG